MVFELKNELNSNGVVLTCWSVLPSVDVVEALAQTDFGAVTLDMQHGGHTEESIYRSIPLIVANGSAPIVRIPVGRNDIASRALDFGAEAVIAPMINSVEDAVKFAAAMKHPPIGSRSWGPQRNYLGVGSKNQDYLENANSKTLSLAMIETREALAVVDDILALDGIDGIFIGPSDFSISWTHGKLVDPDHSDMMEALASLAQKARKAGKVASIFVTPSTLVPKYVEMGYQLLAAGMDRKIIADGAVCALKAATDGARSS